MGADDLSKLSISVLSAPLWRSLNMDKYCVCVLMKVLMSVHQYTHDYTHFDINTHSTYTLHKNTSIVFIVCFIYKYTQCTFVYNESVFFCVYVFYVLMCMLID